MNHTSSSCKYRTLCLSNLLFVADTVDFVYNYGLYYYMRHIHRCRFVNALLRRAIAQIRFPRGVAGHRTIDMVMALRRVIDFIADEMATLLDNIHCLRETCF